MAYDKAWQDCPGLARQDGGCAHVDGVKTALGAFTGGRQPASQTLKRGHLNVQNVYLSDVTNLFSPPAGQETPLTNFARRNGYLFCTERGV